MKKIFTLIAMAMITIGAMAQGNNEKTYEDNIVITVDNFPEPITDRASITITEQAEEGKYTIKLNQFSFQGILIGDVTMTDVQGDDDSEDSPTMPPHRQLPSPMALKSRRCSAARSTLP